MFGSSLPPIVCRRTHVLFTLFLFACVKWCPTHIVIWFCFVVLRLRVSLDCPFFIVPSLFSNVYLHRIYSTKDDHGYVILRVKMSMHLCEFIHYIQYLERKKSLNFKCRLIILYFRKQIQLIWLYNINILHVISTNYRYHINMWP